jgi:hypothetical protein
MKSFQNLTKFYGIGIFLFLLCFYMSDQWSHAQLNFNYFLDSARAKNAELISLKAQRKYLQIESDMIHSVHSSPQVYLSSDIVLVPYFNNNGKLISTETAEKAVGYDIAITDGGLYAFLLNMEYPVLNQNQVRNLIAQNGIEISRIETRINMLELELEHSLANMYFDLLVMQAGLLNARENLHLLSEQVKIVRTLAQNGLYRYLDYKLMETAVKTDSVDYLHAETAYNLGLRQLKITCCISDTSISPLAGYEIQQKPCMKDFSLFLRGFQEDSLAAVWQQRVFNNRYRPQIRLFTNSGLNSTSIPGLGYHMGLSAGLQFTCQLLDGSQKDINRQQQMILIDEAARLRELKKAEVRSRQAGYSKAIESTRISITKEEVLKKEYDELLLVYSEELKNAQISIIDYLNFLQQYSKVKLSLDLNAIALYKLINEYNYWCH